MIELLVVISIVALLLSILIPSLKKVKQQARIVICKTNLRTLMLATNMYCEQYHGKTFAYDAYISGGTLFINKMEPFIANMDRARYCPETRVDRTFDRSFGTSRIAWRWYEEYGSYAINGWLYNDELGQLKEPWYPDWDSISYGNTLNNIAQPHLVPMYVDCAWVDRWPSDTDTITADHDLYDPYLTATSHMSMLMMERHGGIGNVAFVDGHADDIKLEEFWAMKWRKDFKIQHNMTRDDETAIYRNY